jgi:hypothetical protein
MSYAHARRYLFALYASSKEQRRDQVGRFGVGFWSILRFEPKRIVIRSRPRLSRRQVVRDMSPRTAPGSSSSPATSSRRPAHPQTWSPAPR